MPYAYDACSVIDGRPAGHVGIFLKREHYTPYRSAPSVRWKRIVIDDAHAALMREHRTDYATADKMLKAAGNV